MASIHKDILIDASPEAVWDAVRDVGRIHERLCPGFVVDCDETRRRLVWTAKSERLAHHNGAMQVEAAGQGRARAVWTADVLPHAAAETVGAMMEQGLAAMKARLDGAG